MLIRGIHPLTRQTMAQFESKNIKPTYEDIINLNDLARDGTTDILSSDPTTLTMQYKTICGLNIYPLTVGARLWLQTVYTIVYDPVILSVAPIYAACNSRTVEKLPQDKKSIVKALIDFSKKCNLTEDEIKEICGMNKAIDAFESDLVSLLNDIVAQIKNNPQELDLSRIQSYFSKMNKEHEAPITAINLLMHVYGQTANYWLWEVSEEFFIDALENANRILHEGEDNKNIDPTDPTVIAYVKFRALVKEIEKRELGN